MNGAQAVVAIELPWIWAGIAAYALAASAALVRVRARSSGVDRTLTPDRAVLPFLALALVLIGTGIGLRWERIGHGPFISLFEILASSLWSLGLVFALAYWCFDVVRRTAPVVLGLLLVMGTWLLVTSAADTHLPPTYETPVLWFHLAFGKLFLGSALTATGIAAVVLLRASPRPARWFRGMPADAALEGVAWKFMFVALVFESLMLIAGAVWAQDAWGRYWAWDPLETWSFATWVTLSAAIHARIAFRLSARTSAVLVIAVFVLAFLTFFGIPFVSSAPHQGAL